MLQVLLAEDNPGDILLVQEALAEHHILHELHVVQDGARARRWCINLKEEFLVVMAS